VSAIGGAIAALLLIFDGPWVSLFTTDVEVIAETRKIFPLVALYILFDAMGPGFMNQVLRAVSHVSGPAMINVFSLYGFGIPLGAFLTFGLPKLGLGTKFGESWGIYGLWTGLNAGMICMVLGLVVYSLCCVDFEIAAKKAVDINVASQSNQSSRGGAQVVPLDEEEEEEEEEEEDLEEAAARGEKPLSLFEGGGTITTSKSA
jgi:hypothetical protein